MKHVIIGTAGHVDHGKTSLIRALTGTDPDRLKEEQVRGMTIDLGFAALRLPNGDVAGIVDVPGHERFLKNMLAGAGGVDVALLVIAADEGVMPQTTEHLDILDLLGVRTGVVALTKADLVDAEWLHMVEEEVRSLLGTTSLAGAPIVCVDSLSGRGLEDLVQALSEAVAASEPRDLVAPARLPVDRVFTMPGFGPVVTGTLITGTVRAGDTMEVVPKMLTVRVRGIQSHGERLDHAEAGMRTAMNLAGVEARDLVRGDVLAAPGLLAPVHILDASLRVLSRAPKALETGTRVRLHLGTAEVLARVQVLGDRRIEPGASGYVRLRCERAAAALCGDRFVLRTYSPMVTIAGGTVLEVNPASLRRAPADTVASLRIREAGSLPQIVADWLMRQPACVPVSELARVTGAREAAASAALDALVASGEVVFLPSNYVIHSRVLEDLARRAREILEAYHAAHPLNAGMPRQELRTAVHRSMEPRCFAALLQYWHDVGLLAVSANTVRLASFTIQLEPEQAAQAERIVEVLQAAPLGIASAEDVRKAAGAPLNATMPIVKALVEQGTILDMGEGLYAHPAGLKRAQSFVENLIRSHGSVTVAQVRDASGSSRKYALALLEYLDRIGVTIRLGDDRVLAEASGG